MNKRKALSLKYITLIIFVLSNIKGFSDSQQIVFKNKIDQELYNMIILNDLNGVKKMIEKGANVNSADKYNCTTQLMAASKNGHFKIVKLLIKKGADINKHAGLGPNPLIVASGNNQPKVVRYLLKKGADCNFAIEYKETALMWASLNGHINIVKILIENNANLNMQNIEGVTALMFSVQHEKNLETVKYLIENGADPNIKNKKGSSALSWAGKNKQIVKYLNIIGVIE